MVEAGYPALECAAAEAVEAEGGEPLLCPLLHVADVLPQRAVRTLQSVHPQRKEFKVGCVILCIIN